MNRIARLFAIVALFLAVVPLGTAAAQEQVALEPTVPEEVVLQATLDLIRGEAQPIRDSIESPFTDVFAGSPGVFSAIGEANSAATQGLGDQVPFADANVWSFVTAFRPDTNDYFINSPYVVANVVEVTEPVTGCGPGEYREVALFLTRSGMPTIGENPNVPNDPGVGASEAVSLICTAGTSSTFFGLSENGALAQFATPYPVFEMQLDGRHFVAFLTLDPFATYQVVASFASDTTQQEQFGFVRGEAGAYPAAEDQATTGPILDADTLAALNELVGQTLPPAEVSESDAQNSTAGTTDSDTQDDPITEGAPQDTPDPSAEQTDTADGSVAQSQTAEPTSDGGSAVFPVAVGAVAAATVAGAGVAVYRKKKVVSRGVSEPMLSDVEELRVAGERAGLPLVRGWQQVPFALGREFRDRSGVTKRENLVGDERSSNVSFEGRPWQWSDASTRNLDLGEYFGFWINDEGTLRVGNRSEPYQYDSLRDEGDYPVDYSEEEQQAAAPYDRKAEGSATTFDDNELPPA